MSGDSRPSSELILRMSVYQRLANRDAPATVVGPIDYRCWPQSGRSAVWNWATSPSMPTRTKSRPCAHCIVASIQDNRETACLELSPSASAHRESTTDSVVHSLLVIRSPPPPPADWA